MTKANGQFKIGQRVEWTRRSGESDSGKVLAVETTPSGPWVVIAVRGQAMPSRVRPAVIRKG